MGAANAHIRLRRPFKWYYLWPTCHFTWETDPAFCTLDLSQNWLSTSPTDTSTFVTTFVTWWQLSIQHYALFGNSRLTTHIVSQLQMGSVCATRAPVTENLHVHIIPFCTPVVILQCHPKWTVWQVFALVSLLKKKTRQKQSVFSPLGNDVLLTALSSEFDGTLSEAQMLAGARRT